MVIIDVQFSSVGWYRAARWRGSEVMRWRGGAVVRWPGSTAGAGMQQVTDSRKAAARYRAEYLRQSNAPTSAAATCDNTVRCTGHPPRPPHPPSDPPGPPPPAAAAFQTTLS